MTKNYNYPHYKLDAYGHRVRLKLAYGMALAKPVLLFKRPTRIHSHEKTATAAVKLVSVC